MSKKVKTLVIVLFLVTIFILEVNAQGSFVGSIKSDVYHYPSCHYVDNILEENEIWFTSVQDALDHDYRACKVCKPPSTPTIPEPPVEPEPMPEPETPTEPETPEEPKSSIYEPESPTEDILTVFVDAIIDGDSFNTSEGYEIRLADIDAPEVWESGFDESMEYLELLLEDRIITIDIDSQTGCDQYGRYVCLAYVDYNSTHYLNVNQALVEEGYAVVDNYTNNEFEPTEWKLYSQITTIPEFSVLLLIPLFVVIGFLIFRTQKRLLSEKL